MDFLQDPKGDAIMTTSLFRLARLVVTTVALLGLGANIPVAGAETTSTKSSSKSSKKKICENCGTISDIRTIEKEGEGTGLGAVAGGVVGGLLGHQIGGGTGKDLATIAGVAGGAYAGHQVEKKVKKSKSYEVSVQLENGQTEVMPFAEQPPYAVGDKVKIVDGILQRR
jgi:outer membrane lipoprotein SlyB